MQKFKVGDRVRVVDNQKITIGKIDVITNYDERCRIITNNEIFWTDIKCLAPAQALVKVPQFVADYIEDAKKGVYNTLAAAFNCHTKNWDVASWLQNFDDLDGLDYDKAYKNQELFARAWLDGYEVEMEPLYEIVIVKSCVDRQLLFEIGETIEVHYESENEGHWKQCYTEAEILKIDKYDDTNYWQFAVPVEKVGDDE
ncbi:DUF1642 domain-containing protein [Listeria booriae]|uniref:DUF1642 domain-containing protein n=1 Tax=Listeria booriae TaxID=1552123 RepID=UPI0016280D37|nr:DUF1642 domain-containing protein [Listeria booriae]MBC2188691.1 DUF1642 domain-containing protein [Listeria booriae]